MNISSSENQNSLSDKGVQLPLSVCVGWGMGSLGMAIMFGLVSIYALIFMTNYLFVWVCVVNNGERKEREEGKGGGCW